MKNDKNFELTLDQFLNNRIPKDEYKVVRIEENKKEDTMQIDTTTSSKSINAANNGNKSGKGQQSDLLQQYMLGQFEGSKARRNKNRVYYDEHIRAIEQQRDDEAAGDNDLKRKMLHLANMMQYEDDFDD